MGIIERKMREKQQRKDDIVLAAESVFFLKGFENATMEDIADKAELSKGTLYLYFKSKEDLHMAVAIRAIGLMNTLSADIGKMKLNGIEKLVRLGMAFIEFSRKFPDHMNSILSLEGLDIQKTSLNISGLRAVIYKDSPVKLVMDFIRQGVEEAIIRGDIPPAVIANTLWMQMLGVIQIGVFKNSLFEMIEMTPEALYESHIELVLNGIKS